MENQLLVEKKVEYLVNMQISKMQNQMNYCVSEIQKMAEEVQMLKNKVNRLNMGVTNNNPQTTLSSNSSVSVERPKQPQVPNARTGNINPSDVSIEKMFYFGNK